MILGANKLLHVFEYYASSITPCSAVYRVGWASVSCENPTELLLKARRPSSSAVFEEPAFIRTHEKVYYPTSTATIEGKRLQLV
jgi:hypothetical protein